MQTFFLFVPLCFSVILLLYAWKREPHCMGSAFAFDTFDDNAFKCMERFALSALAESLLQNWHLQTSSSHKRSFLMQHF